MDEVIDSNLNPLIELVEEYVSRKRNHVSIDIPYFKSKLQHWGYSSEQIHDLLIEMDDDADKELLAGDGSKKAKQKLIISLIVVAMGMTVSIAGATGLFGAMSLGVFFIPFMLVGGALVTAGKANTEIGLVKKRRISRAFKYGNWK